MTVDHNLDVQVATIEGWRLNGYGVWEKDDCLRGHVARCSSNWLDGGNLIDKYDISVAVIVKGELYEAHLFDHDDKVARGPTYLIAAMRALVLAKGGTND